MQENCPVCKGKREFNHISRDAMENVYECEKCSFQLKRKTAVGWAATVAPGAVGGGLFGGLMAAVLGAEHDDDSHG